MRCCTPVPFSAAIQFTSLLSHSLSLDKKERGNLLYYCFLLLLILFRDGSLHMRLMLVVLLLAPSTCRWCPCGWGLSFWAPTNDSTRVLLMLLTFFCFFFSHLSRFQMSGYGLPHTNYHDSVTLLSGIADSVFSLFWFFFFLRLLFFHELNQEKVEEILLTAECIHVGFYSGSQKICLWRPNYKK